MITLKWEIIWTGGLPHLSRLPHLPGVPHLHVNRALGSTRSHRDLTKSRRVLGEISYVYLAEISFISARSRLSRRNIFHLARVSARSRQYLARDRFISCRSQRYHKSRRVLDKISARSHLSPCDLKDITNLAEVLARSRLSRRDLRDITNLAEFSSRLTKSRRDVFHLSEISSRLTRSWRDFCHLGEISLISPRYRRDLCDNTNQYNSREHAWDWSSQAESQIVRIPLQSFIPCLFALLLAVKLKPESISQGDRQLIVNMTILETWDA